MNSKTSKLTLIFVLIVIFYSTGFCESRLSYIDEVISQIMENLINNINSDTLDSLLVFAPDGFSYGKAISKFKLESQIMEIEKLFKESHLSEITFFVYENHLMSLIRKDDNDVVESYLLDPSVNLCAVTIFHRKELNEWLSNDKRYFKFYVSRDKKIAFLVSLNKNNLINSVLDEKNR